MCYYLNFDLIITRFTVLSTQKQIFFYFFAFFLTKTRFFRYNIKKKEGVNMSGSLGNKEIMANNIRRHLDHLGLNVKDFASLMNFKYSTVLDWVNAKTYPRIDKIELMANYFKVEKSDLVESYKPQQSNLTHDKVAYLDKKLHEPRHSLWVDHGERLLEEQKQAQNSTIAEPLYEYRVFEKLSAGTGTAYWEDKNYDTVYFDEELDHDFASWVYGDSMEPKYLDGSVALIKDTVWDYDGAIYAVDWDGQSYIKKVYKEKDGLRLVSLNPKYQDKFAPFSEDPRIIGKVVGSFTPAEN